MQSLPLAGISLLVADDHVDSADLLELLLAGKGAEVRAVYSGAAALEVLQTFRPDLALLDITLPDMDGYELLGRIRTIEGLETLSAIAVTGHAGERDRAKAAAAGFSVHTIKPIDIEALVHLITRQLAAADSVATTARDLVIELDELLRTSGVHGALRFLNGRTSHRYTALYRYDGPTLRSVALFDRLEPTATKGSDVPVETSFCWLVWRDRATFATENGGADERVVGLPLRPDVRSYCGALVRNADGTPFGSLCHFDHEPREISRDEVALLERFAPSLAREFAIDVF